MTIGQRIAKCRKNKNLSQEYIAEALEVTRQAVSKWETDVNTPDTHNLIKLSKLFGVSVEYLACGEDFAWSLRGSDTSSARNGEASVLDEAAEANNTQNNISNREESNNSPVKEKSLITRFLGIIIMGLGFVLLFVSLFGIFVPLLFGMSVLLLAIGGGMAFREKPFWV